MNHVIRCLCALVLPGLLIGCDSQGQEEPPFAPGVISLSVIGNSSESTDSFDLRDIKNTKTFNFYLSNKGDTDVFDVAIESSNTAFLVDPPTIRVLPAGGQVSLEQSLQITAVHGTSPSGLGPTAPLPMGVNQTTLHIQAKTTDQAGDTLNLDLQTDIMVNACL